MITQPAQTGPARWPAGVGIGLDFKTGTHGAVRLEGCRFIRLGGTRYNEDLMNLGYHGDF